MLRARVSSLVLLSPSTAVASNSLLPFPSLSSTATTPHTQRRPVTSTTPPPHRQPQNYKTMSTILAPGEGNLFVKMSRGEIPCHKIAENEHWFAFLDINPLSPNHTLVVPKKAAERSTDIPEEALPSFGPFLHKVIKTVVPEGTPYNILQNNGGEAGQVVMQVHFHIIPKLEDMRGLKVEWKAESADQGELAKSCAALKAKFESL